MDHRAHRPVQTFAALCAAVQLAACNQFVDLAAVQKYAETTASAAASFDALARDYGRSCRRRRSFVAPPADLRFLAIPLADAVESPRTIAVAPAPAAPSSMSTLSNCTAEDAAAAEWMKRNGIVLGYVRSLGALAGADQVPKFDALGTALVNQNVIDQTQDDAFTGLLGAIALSATHAGQEDAIARTARDAAEPLRRAVKALKIIDASYANQLQAEYDAVNETYKTRICDELLAVIHQGPSAANVGRCTLPPGFPSAIPSASRLAVQTTSADAARLIDDVNARRVATVEYAKAIDTIVATNDDIVRSADRKASAAQIAAIVKKHFGDLVTAVAGVQKAVK
ncbi:MAG: hypothetical protein NVS3B7_07920 [Candidatus Elarobacter sp.]